MQMKYDSAVLNIRMQQFSFYEIQMYVVYYVISVRPAIIDCSSFYIKKKTFLSQNGLLLQTISTACVFINKLNMMIHIYIGLSLIMLLVYL